MEGEAVVGRHMVWLSLTFDHRIADGALAAQFLKAIKDRIVGVKTSHPEYGPRRIAAVLKRFFLVSASATSVHKTLSGEGLTGKAKSKPVKNPAK